MARRSKHDTQVDPFNAGEPTLPWDEPDAPDLLADRHHAEDCAFGEEPYTSPTKMRDNYSAPDSDAPKKPSGDGLTPRQRKQAARAKAKSERRAAKAAPKDTTKPRRGKRSVFSLIIILIALVNIVPSLFSTAFDLVRDVTAPLASLLEPEPEIDFDSDPIGPDAPQDGDSSGDASGYELDEQECIALVDEYLSAELVSDHTRDLLVKTLNADCDSALLGTCEELGIDAQAWADWEMSHLSYTIDSCFVYTEDNTATVYVSYTTAGGIFELQDIYDEIDRYLKDIDAWDEEWNLRPLSDAEKTKVGDMFTEGMADIDAEQETLFGSELVRKDGEWAINEDAMTETMSMVLGVW